SNHEELRRKLTRMEGEGYGNYQGLRGTFAFHDFTLFLDQPQWAPWAGQSRFRIVLSKEGGGFPPETSKTPIRRIALGDFLTRRFAEAARRLSKPRGDASSGKIDVDRPGQEVLDRTSVRVIEGKVEVRFAAGLPGVKRRVSGKEAAEMICNVFPQLVDTALRYRALNADSLRRHLETVEDAEALREQLAGRGLAAFIADGSLLPRKSGVDEHPLEKGAEPFRTPESLAVVLDRPNAGPIRGMGIPRGVTLIVGGGFHGKSTLLHAVERGVYNHIPGDGRESVVSDPAAVKVRAEDGRRVAGVDISPFIGLLPGGRSTTAFSTDNASGSTSQAASIIEALEAGAKVLLMDEDTSATNFMIRDHRMQELIVKEKEPITPFIDKVRQLFGEYGVSTILVMGGSGDYFDVADTVIAMESFIPHDVTEKARGIAKKYAAERKPEGGDRFGEVRPRVPLAESLDPGKGKRPVRVGAPDTETLVFGGEDIDLSAVEQVVDESQVRAIAQALVHAKRRHMGERITLAEILNKVMADVASKGLDVLTPSPSGDLAGFRRFELAAALNRLRTLRVSG
ncbi:MAG: ABC-ATPase domain-containing protein, partial [Nitrospirae bacterium]|nr:ABC-ATPase domain-containing protein [Nitrospirota bacterium]